MAAKRKQIKKIKLNHLDFLKALTKWISSPRRNPETIKILVDRYGISNRQMYQRIASFCYGKPHIIRYFNTYFNNLFELGKIETSRLVQDMVYVMEQNDMTNSRNFVYLKSSELRDTNKQKVKKLIKEYSSKIYNRQMNDMELNFYYELFKTGIISVDELKLMDAHVNGDEVSKLTIDETIRQEQQVSEEEIEKYIEDCRVRPLPEPISNFCIEMKKSITENLNCSKKCKLHGSPIVVLDTNMEDFGPVDFMFVALNPGKDEKTFNKPLVGRSGKFFRRRMFFLPDNITWVITNTMLCFTKDQNEISKSPKKVVETAKNCTGNLNRIMEKFPPRVVVTMGGPAMEIMGVNGTVTSRAGDMVNVDGRPFKRVIPLIHPSGAMRQGNNKKAFELGWNVVSQVAAQISEAKSGNVTKPNLQTAIQKPTNIQAPVPTINIPQQTSRTELPQENISDHKSSISKYNIPEDKLITSISEDLTLFDIIDLNAYKMAYIFIDPNGNKKYLIDDYEIPIFVKEGEWTDRKMLVDSADMRCMVNGWKKRDINKIVKSNLQMIKKSVIRS